MYYNTSHCKDPTAGAAIGKITGEQRAERKKLLFVLHFIAERTGYKITNIKLERLPKGK